MKNKGIKKLIIGALTVILACTSLFAHSGRTDSSGGHKDNKNKSGLGSYHYHCGGYPAHLHENGICPYKSGGSTSSSSNRKPSAPKYTSKTAHFMIQCQDVNIECVVVNDTNLVELRPLCEQLGISILSYDTELKSIECKKDDVEFILQIDSKNMWKNNESITLDVAPVIYNDKTMVPARVVAEAIGKTVIYNSNTDNIIIE